MTPEQKARQIIDHQLEKAGWNIVDRNEYQPNLLAMAVREGLMKHNLEADYLLFMDGKAVGVIEAKRQEIDVINNDNVKNQAINYAYNLPNWCRSWILPLPLVYISNGDSLYYKDIRKPDSDFVEIKEMHSPYEIISNFKIGNMSGFFAGLTKLQKLTLRDCQYEAIQNLEESFRDNGKKRALMVLATGAGKTFTACMAAYRLLSFTKTRRILFLVDRNNLGRQANKAFAQFNLTDNGETFSNTFDVQILKNNVDVSKANVVIATIQRLYSYVTGQELEDDNDDSNDIISESYDKIIQFDTSKAIIKPDFFDVIIIDECHRSIYGENWRKVLEYFGKAYMIGLTATPELDTFAFFDNNVVVDYTQQRSIADNVNVGERIYRIMTKVSEEGGTIDRGRNFKNIERYTGTEVNTIAAEPINYLNTDLNRAVVNLDQIELVLQTFKDEVYVNMYPDREPNFDYLPKTLIFALNDNHATNIVDIARKVFGKQADTDFVQKITYSAGDSNKLISEFNNNKKFRIAVTVTLVSTGTDIPSLEIVMFMRDVNSRTLYTQMKGRGCRTIADTTLQDATPNAKSKELYYLVDAVGVSEHELYNGIRRNDTHQPLPSLEKLLERISHGELSDDKY